MNEALLWERQLALNLHGWHPQRFDTFNEGHNELAVLALQHRQEYPLIYLWGGSGAGKTHLLQAVCADREAKGLRGIYLDMAMGWDPMPEEDEAKVDCLCIDNVDAVAGDETWERGVFALVNRIREAKKPIVVAAAVLPQKAGFQLKDLESRLCWGPEFYLQDLDDAAKRQILTDSARRRGVEFPEDSLDFLLRRAQRDLKNLMRLLDRLDAASLAAQRRLSIPFLKKVLNL